MSLNILSVTPQNAASIRFLINKLSGQNIIPLTSTNIFPKNLQIYQYNLTKDQDFTFQDQNKTISFRLYLSMPQQVYKVNLPSNIEWEEIPMFNQNNTLYMLVFEWNTNLNKWLGNLMWKSSYISNYENSSESDNSLSSISSTNSREVTQ